MVEPATVTRFEAEDGTVYDLPWYDLFTSGRGVSEAIKMTGPGGSLLYVPLVDPSEAAYPELLLEDPYGEDLAVHDDNALDGFMDDFDEMDMRPWRRGDGGGGDPFVLDTADPIQGRASARLDGMPWEMWSSFGLPVYPRKGDRFQLLYRTDAGDGAGVGIHFTVAPENPFRYPGYTAFFHDAYGTYASIAKRSVYGYYDILEHEFAGGSIYNDLTPSGEVYVVEFEWHDGSDPDHSNGDLEVVAKRADGTPVVSVETNDPEYASGGGAIGISSRYTGITVDGLKLLSR